MASSVNEWVARALRPVAHWVTMPDATGRPRLVSVWEVLDPLPADAGSVEQNSLGAGQAAPRG
jgi:hypothetical protein